MMTLTTHSVVFIVVSDSNQSTSRDRQSHSDVIDEIDILHPCYSVHPRDMCSVLAFCSCQINNVMFHANQPNKQPSQLLAMRRTWPIRGLPRLSPETPYCANQTSPKSVSSDSKNKITIADLVSPACLLPRFQPSLQVLLASSLDPPRPFLPDHLPPWSLGVLARFLLFFPLFSCPILLHKPCCPPSESPAVRLLPVTLVCAPLLSAPDTPPPGPTCLRVLP